jgi:hypothetical protein
MSYILSKHASCRVQQRGVRPYLLAALMAHAEFDATVGGGCSVVRMNSRQLRDPELRQHRERLRRLSVILSDNTGEIVTVLRPRRGSAGRRYRKGAR